VHADRGYFAAAYPDSGELGDAASPDIEIHQGVDQHLLDGSHVCAHIALPLAQVEYGITHDLARPVIGDIAAAIGGTKGDARAGQKILAGEHVFHAAVAADGDGVGMLQQNELIGDGAGLPPGYQLTLPFEGAGIIQTTGLTPFALTH